MPALPIFDFLDHTIFSELLQHTADVLVFLVNVLALFAEFPDFACLWEEKELTVRYFQN